MYPCLLNTVLLFGTGEPWCKYHPPTGSKKVIPFSKQLFPHKKLLILQPVFGKFLNQIEIQPAHSHFFDSYIFLHSCNLQDRRMLSQSSSGILLGGLIYGKNRQKTIGHKSEELPTKHIQDSHEASPGAQNKQRRLEKYLNAPRISKQRCLNHCKMLPNNIQQQY